MPWICDGRVEAGSVRRRGHMKRGHSLSARARAFLVTIVAVVIEIGLLFAPHVGFVPFSLRFRTDWTNTCRSGHRPCVVCGVE